MIRSPHYKKSNNISFLQRIFFCSIILFIIWLFIAPAVLIQKINLKETEKFIKSTTNTNIQNNIFKNNDYSSSPSSSPSFKNNIIKENSPNLIKELNNNKLWTLHNASLLNDNIENLNWFEKGRLILNKNSEYLLNSIGKGNSTNSTITLVSGLFDLGRGDLKNDFTRSFNFYIERFSIFLRYQFPKIIFIQPEHYHYYLPYIKEYNEYPVYIINKTLDDIRSFPYYNYINNIRTDPDWFSQESWLSQSPQATLPLYNPMVMSKILWTRDAAQINPFNTDTFLWIDGGHQCNEPDYITQDNSFIFKQHFDKLLITYFDYEPYQEIHGFKRKPFYDYIDNRTKSILVGRGGIFGGTKEYLEVSSEIYMLALEDSLKSGYMGTEENIFSILLYRFPELIHKYLNGPGGNCAIFYEAIHGPQPPPLPPPVYYIVEDGLDLRKASCEITSNGISCYTNGIQCPDYVTPIWLHSAPNQYTCQQKKDFYCTIQCQGKDSDVSWYAHSCPFYDICPPHGTIHWSEFYDKNPFIELLSSTESSINNNNDNDNDIYYYNNNDNYNTIEYNYPRIIPPPLPTIIPQNELSFTSTEITFMNNIRDNYNKETTDFLIEYGYDLRGLQCEIKDNKEVCFSSYRSGRDLCPDFVDSRYLSLASDQYSCTGEMKKTHYCTAMCQEGVNRVSWTAFEKEWCSQNINICPPEPRIIPYNDFFLKEWTLEEPIPKLCEITEQQSFISPFTIGILTRGNELETLKYSMNTWIKDGFLELASEVLIMVNEITKEMKDYLLLYTNNPINLKILESTNNEGILRGLNWLMGNSTNDYFLFLEKDFRLVEPISCVIEQINTGINLITNKQAHVIKYRSRYNAGKPNWAEISYKGREDDIFNIQPNLLCNFYHWIDTPVKRWPNYFKLCNENPIFYCVDSEYCNWTNNPFLISKLWWFENYYFKFNQISKASNDFNLEGFMNWDINAWNNRNWIIAEGDGLFKHADANNFGG